MDALISGARSLGIEISPLQREQFEAYYRELAEWNRRVNLTAIGDYEQVQLRHFLDSLSVVRALEKLGLGLPGSALEQESWLDVGAGAGFPGLPLKIVFSDIRLTLMESVGKKVAFLTHMVGLLGLDEVEVLTGRAETLAHQTPYREGFHRVLSRALSPLPTLVELTLPFVRVGGVFLAHKKGNIATELKAAVRATEVMGGQIREVVAIDLPGLTRGRVIVAIEKLVPSPVQYPRRPGVPQKRPLL